MAPSCCVMARRSFVTTEVGEAGVVISGSVGQGGANAHNDVKLVQTLLNLVAPASLSAKAPLKLDGMIGPLTMGAITQFQRSVLGFADGRIDPHGRTLARLNVLAFNSGARPATLGGSAAKGLVGAPTPPVPTRLTPLAAAIAATPQAQFWCAAARTHIAGLLLGLKASGGVILLPLIFDMINTHFHLDRDPGSIMLNLSKIDGVLARIQIMLGDPSKFYAEGVETASSKFADAPMGGMKAGPPFDKITFRTQYPDCGPMCRAAMLVHEGAHFCGGVNEIGHFAHEFPIPDGAPQDGSSHNYAQMSTSEAMRNASSYAAFAIHAAFLVDHRFGLDKKGT